MYPLELKSVLTAQWIEPMVWLTSWFQTWWRACDIVAIGSLLS